MSRPGAGDPVSPFSFWSESLLSHGKHSPIGDPHSQWLHRQAMVALVALFLLANLIPPSIGNAESFHGQSHRAVDSGHFFAAPVCCRTLVATSRNRQFPARSATSGHGGTAHFLSGATDEFAPDHHTSDPDDTNHSVALVDDAVSCRLPTAARSMATAHHVVSECARRGMRTSGRHPPS